MTNLPKNKTIDLNVTGKLDKILNAGVGSGQLEAGARLGPKSGVNLYLDYEHRINRNLGVFGYGSYSPPLLGKGEDYNAGAGFRLRF